MTREEQKDLLLKDLSARLPYGVKIQVNNKIEILEGIGIPDNIIEYDSFLSCEVEEVKPYLFPLSSMTGEQKKYISDRWGINEDFDFEINPNWGKYFVDLGDVVNYINWLNENHFDYRGLIEKGLAIDCTNLNIY